MIDWSTMAKIAGGGYGTTIIVLLILSLAAWVMGVVAQKSQARSRGDSEKG